MSAYKRRVTYSLSRRLYRSRKFHAVYIVILTLLCATVGGLFVTSALFHAATPLVQR